MSIYADVSLTIPPNVIGGRAVLNTAPVSDLTASQVDQMLNFPSVSMGLGVGAGLINFKSKLYQGTLAAGGFVLIDLASLLDAFGNTFTTLARVNHLMCANLAVTDGANLIIGAASLWPGIAVTGAVSGSDGTLAVGNYLASYTLVNANGESMKSVDSAPIAVASTNHILFTFPALPTGAVSRNLYLSTAGGASNTQVKQNAAPITTLTTTVTALASLGALPTDAKAYFGGFTGPWNGKIDGCNTIGPGFAVGNRNSYPVLNLPAWNTTGFVVTGGSTLVQLWNPGTVPIPYAFCVWGDDV